MTEITYATAMVIHAISSGRRHGFQIMEAAGLPSGTVYPALRRLEKAGLVRSRWEPQTMARSEQRPARRNYQLTRAGEEELARAAERFRFPELATEAQKTAL
jgi:DNA-binding PadR family transcriptional regulator